MALTQSRDGVQSRRLTPEDYRKNFSDLHPPLSRHEALVAADRCYFCHDAPCVVACPTRIDIPMFIRQIASDNPIGAAKTIFDQNILGGMCARVCPTETLCEQACVRELAEGRPVEIGQLQRFATDIAMADGRQFYRRAAPSGKRIAVVGAGPAGLACAHRLAVYGHDVVMFDARPKAGGLNEYGIAAYKTVDDFAAAEVEYVTAVGGITVQTGKALGHDMTLDELVMDYDAVFLGIGLGGVNALRIDGPEHCISDAVEYIADLRQAADLSEISVGRKVVVIGGGMTAIDVAVQAKLLGAEQVTICYRRGQEQMSASRYEQDLATSKGVSIRHWLQPVRVLTDGSRTVGVEMEYTTERNGQLIGTGEAIILEADQIFRAIGQTLMKDDVAGLKLLDNRIYVDDEGRTSRTGVWAGGDCVVGGEDLTVSAVAMGRDAAESINRSFSGGEG